MYSIVLWDDVTFNHYALWLNHVFLSVLSYDIMKWADVHNNCALIKVWEIHLMHALTLTVTEHPHGHQLHTIQYLTASLFNGVARHPTI